MDLNKDNVAPWNIDGMDLDPDSDGCVEPKKGKKGAGSCHGVAPPTLGMNDVTTATGCAVSRRSARTFWESPRALILLAVRSKEDQHFAVVNATVTVNFRLIFELVRDLALHSATAVQQYATRYMGL